MSEQDFVAVQRLRTRRATGSGEVREYLFAGVLRCGICGQLTAFTWDNENHTGSFSVMENDPVW
ncbi:hypothetical protein [Saccharothrix carnea]|uniref:hypothetical protein n=1 Tax=Saccharothrix carnea TaxID=1280637 RepID=UPI0011B1D8AF|nr:hypothetical protein [Saccharothrix carnea]